MPRGISRFRGAEKQTILDLDTRTKSALSADANDYDLSVGACFNIGGDTTDRTITGIAGGREGRVIQLVNTLGYYIYLTNESSASLAQNRILTTMQGGGTFTIPPNGGSVFLSYNNVVNRWVVLHGTPTTYTPETDANAMALFRNVAGRRSGGMMTQTRALQLLAGSQGPLRLKFTNKISGDTASQAFGPVSGCSVTFTMPAVGDVLMAVSGTSYTSLQIIRSISMGVRIDGGTALVLADSAETNGSGSDFVGDEHLCAIYGTSLSAGSHTIDLCWGDSAGTYGLRSNASQPLTIGVLYPG